MRGRRLGTVLFASATALLTLSLLTAILDPLPEGLSANYFRTTNWSGAPARTNIDATPSTYYLFLAWRGTPPPSFSAMWTGSILILRDGTYTFGTSDGSSVSVGERLVADNSDASRTRPSTESVRLSRGVHRLLVTYSQANMPPALDVSWARNGAPLAPIPAYVLAPRPAPFTRFVISMGIRRVSATAVWPWLAATTWLVVVAVIHPFRRAYAARDFRAAFEWGLLFTGGLVLIFLLPHQISSDGYVRYFALAKLIEWREPSSTLYSFVGPLSSAPFYFLGNVIASPYWWCARFNTFVLIGGICVMWQLLRKQMASAVFRKFALLLIAASMFVNHVQDYFGEVFTAVLAATGLVAVQFGHALTGWAAAILGVANTPATIAGLGASATLSVWRTRRLRQFVPVVLAASVIMLESWIRRGAALDTGYIGTAGNRTVLTYSGRPGFSYPLFFGLLSVLFSFGKGLIFYAPGLILPVRQHIRALGAPLLATYDLWLAFLTGLIVVYAKWWAWFGGWTWGPRFFLFAAIPASLALAVALERHDRFSVTMRFGVLVVLTLSAWVAIDGAAFGLAALDVCLDDTFASLCWYVPEFSPLWRPFVHFTAPSPAQVTVAMYVAVAYLWLAAPLVQDLSPKGIAMVGEAWRALRQGAWRI